MKEVRLKNARIGLALSVLSAAVVFTMSGCKEQGAADGMTGTSSTTNASAETPVKRGEYLVTVMGCNDCHTPFKMGVKGPEPDMTKMLSGHPEGKKMPAAPKLDHDWMWVGASTNTAFAGPWGVSYSANITPDKSTGIGGWTEELFIQAIRGGKHFGVSRPIMPPMPWMWLAKATDDDLKAIFAYLMSVPPLANKVPEYEPPSGGLPSGAGAGPTGTPTAAPTGAPTSTSVTPPTSP